MSIQPGHLEALLDQINGGRAAGALPELDQLQQQHPQNLAVMQLRAEALRHAGRPADAIAAYRRAAEAGAGTRNWLAAGILLAAERNIDEAVNCLTRAYTANPDDQSVLDALVTTLFNSGRHKQGIDYARRQLAIGTDPTLMSRAALLLQSNDLYEESSEAFKRIVRLAPEDASLAGAALVPARFTCEWDWIESLQRRITDCYARGDFDSPHEYPLTHLTWCPDEQRNLGVTRAYVRRMVPRGAAVATSPRPAGGRIRVGYLSSDFRNHATMHLMAGMLEHHDRDRFEIFAYDYTVPDTSGYRQRFLDAVEHHVPVYAMTDEQAAARIAADGVDILFDLKLYTGGGRSGIASHRPAPLIAAWLGYPGSAGSPDIDYIVSDRFVTPDSSAPHYTEKFCRLPHSYQCNDRKRATASSAGTRAEHGLPGDGIVFGAFNQSYKIDRGSFAAWMRILQAVPGSVLWLLGQSDSARANLAAQATLAGIGPERIVFAPFADTSEHLARLQLADAVLDTLICNGHTTTSDALWAGVPVITARGAHFASRVSESLLNAMGLPELVGADVAGMVDIARRIGTDAAYRAELRTRVGAHRFTQPLFDTARFTRDFETAIELMVERSRRGLAPEHIDVPDRRPPLAPPAAKPRLTTPEPSLREPREHCPMCGAAGTAIGRADWSAHPLWHAGLPPTIEWARCDSCGAIHTRHHWTTAGMAEVLRNDKLPTPADIATEFQRQRETNDRTVRNAATLLGGRQRISEASERPIWVDIGCGSGALVMTAADHGFAAIGVDRRGNLVSTLRGMGVNAVQQDFMQLDFEITPDVLSMMGVLDRLPDPRAALIKAARVLRPGGVMVLSLDDTSSFGWRLGEAAGSNLAWKDPERSCLIDRNLASTLLQECGLKVMDSTLSGRGHAEREFYAVKVPDQEVKEPPSTADHHPLPVPGPGAIEDDFPNYSAGFKHAAARVPTALAVSQRAPDRVLVVGSCFFSALSESVETKPDFLLFNGGVLPDPPEPPASYDFQLVQIPLRRVLTDESLWHLPLGDSDAYDRVLDECLQRLRLYFQQFTKFNREHGLLTFVSNFIVPTQNPNGRLLRRYDNRNVQHLVHRLNEALEQECLQASGCFMLDLDSIVGSYGKRFFTDESYLWYAHGALMPLFPEPDLANRIEPTPHIVEHFELLDQRTLHRAIYAEATAMWRTCRRMDQVKMIVVDLDDTLWKGVSGEMEAVERIDTKIWPLPVVPMSEGWPLGVAEALLYCKKRGIILGIISKNDERRIRGIFSEAFDHKLSLDDFSIVRINWESKSRNMRDILDAVNVLPENVVFIDDNPVERASMLEAFPSMRVIGRYVLYTRSILLWSPETQVALVTDESARKTEMLQAQVRREEVRGAVSEGEFLASLNASATFFEIGEPGHPRFPRALELINKTNQWNSTGMRLDAPTLSARLLQGWRLFGLSVSDRFTRYGDVAFILCDGDTAPLFVMSCRVIGLQAEACLLREVMRAIGTPELRILFTDTGKNAVIKSYLDSRCKAAAGGAYLLPMSGLPAPGHITLT